MTPRGGWVAVWPVSILHGDKFADLTHAQLGAWLRLRCAQEMTNEPFTRKAAGRLGVTESVLNALLSARLLDDVGDELLTIHDLEENRPHRKPSDAPEATRQRQTEYRARHAAAVPPPATRDNALARDVTPPARDLGSGDGDGDGSISGEGESEGERNQPDISELHPITRIRKPRVTTGPVPALAGPVATPEPTPPPTGDPFDAMYGRFPKPTSVDWHSRLLKTYGPQRVAAAMRQAIEAGAGPATCLGDAEKILTAGKAAAAEANRSAEIENSIDRQKREQAVLEAAAARDAEKVAAGFAAIRAQLGYTAPQAPVQ